MPFDRARTTLLILWLSSCSVACGGVAVEHRAPDGGTGGSAGSGGAPSSGGAPGKPLDDCVNPLPGGNSCSTPSSHCGGPCVNSWQADYVCSSGAWTFARTVACGPNASHAPQCHNSFSAGALTPCCPPEQLDCTGKPDGYPGFGCTPGENSFCSCTCSNGMQVCGC